MSAYAKDHNDNNLCKKHTSRCDKDYRSVCPSKLSKSELEDLYYSLLDNNLELKRTNNAQTEKIRILSTKVQRMTALTKTYGGKDCSAAGKAFVNEQKAVIADLTKANEALADRVRRLSTQLCTARQFLKQNPNARHCYKCYVNATMSVKNFSTTSLHNKTSDANLKSVTSAIFPEREPPTARTETASPNNGVKDVKKDEDDNECSKNKCRSTVEDLKQRIKELEEELSKTQKEHYSQISHLETQVSHLQSEAVRARSEQVLRARDDARALERKLRDIGADYTELESQLSIEKKIVAELEMRLKAAELSQQVSRTIEEHLATASRLEEKQLRQPSVARCSVCSNCAPEDVSPRPMPSVSKRPNELTVPDDKLSKSDDSGYVDHRRESDSNDKATNMIHQELIKRIAEMQGQLDALQISSTLKFKNYGKESDDNKVLRNEKILTEYPEISVSEPTKDLSDQLGKNPVIVSRLQLPENYQNSPPEDTRYNNNKAPNKDKKLNMSSGISKYLENNTFSSDVPQKEKDDVKDPTTKNNERNNHQVIELDSNSESANVNKETESDSHLSKQLHNKTCRGNSEEELNTKGSSSIVPFSEPSYNKSDNHISKQILVPLPEYNNPVTNKQNEHRKRASQNWKKVKKYGKQSGAVEEINKVVSNDKSAARKGHDDKNIKNLNNFQNKKTDYIQSDVASNSNDQLQTQKTYNLEVNQIRETFDFGTSSYVHNEKGDPLKIRDCNSRTYALEKSANMRKSSRIAEFDSVLKQPPIGTSTPKVEHRPRSHTYTVDSDKSRPTSPDNTDNEISVMTDLPTEREASTPRDVLSPGEQKMTGTSTTTTYSFNNDVTLSEGEVPTGKYLQRRTSKSVGEVQSMDFTNEDESIGEAKKSCADKMDAALHAISQELARCRALMHRQRPRNLAYGQTLP